MSGEYRRTVSIGEDELSRLQRAERELRAVNSNITSVIDGVRHEAARSLRQSIEPLERRQQATERHIGQLSEEIQRQERQTIDILNRHRQAFEHEIDVLRGDVQELADWTSNELYRQREEFERMLEDQRSQLEEEIDSMNSRLNIIEEREHQRHKLAAQRIADARILANIIESGLLHKKFMPGKLDEEKQKIALAIRNLDNDMAQTALSSAQDVVQSLIMMRRVLPLMEEEWQTVRVSAIQQLRLLAKKIEQNRYVTAKDIDGNDVPDVKVDVNQWSCGKLSILEKEIEARVKEISPSNSQLETEELRAIIASIMQYEQKLEKIIYEARLAILGADQRFVIADTLAIALEEQGFSLNGNTCVYEENDESNAAVAKLSRRDGVEIVIRVVPVDLGCNEIEIHSFDRDQITEHELQERQRALSKILEERCSLRLGKEKCIAQPNHIVLESVSKTLKKQAVVE